MRIGQEQPAAHRHRRGGLLPAGQQLRLAARAPVRAQRRPAGHGGAEQVVQPEPQPRAQRDSHLRPRRSGPRYPVDHLGRHPVRGAAAVRHPDPRPHPADGSGEPAAGHEPDRAVPDSSRCGTSGSSARKRCCWPTAGCCSPPASGPTGAAPTATPESIFFYPKAAASYRFIKPVRRRGRDQAPRRLRPDRQPRALRRASSRPTRTGDDRRELRAPSSATGPAIPTIKPERQKEFEGGFDATLANGRAELTLDGLPAEHHATCSWSRRWRPRSGQEIRIFSSGQHAAEPGRRGVAHPVSRSRPRTSTGSSGPPSSPTAARSPG